MPRQHWKNLPDIAQDKSRANIEQKDKIVQNISTENHLKELPNYKRKLFLSPPKNRRKYSQHFKTAVFHNKFTVCHIKPNICT